MFWLGSGFERVAACNCSRIKAPVKLMIFLGREKYFKKKIKAMIFLDKKDITIIKLLSPTHTVDFDFFFLTSGSEMKQLSEEKGRVCAWF